MTISNEEMAHINELICAIMDDSGEDFQGDDALNTDALFKALDRLRMAHGELPILLSTRADFIDEPEESLALYLRAVELARESQDICCLIQSLESIVEIYTEDLLDYDNGLKYYQPLAELVEEHGTEYCITSLSDLKANLNRLTMKVV